LTCHTGTRVSEDSRKYGAENTCTSGSALSKPAMSYSSARMDIERERENLLKTLVTQVIILSPPYNKIYFNAKKIWLGLKCISLTMIDSYQLLRFILKSFVGLLGHFVTDHFFSLNLPLVFAAKRVSTSMIFYLLCSYSVTMMFIIFGN
jgi:hypothetical protein